MENTYGQFCTVARGAEVLCGRWTPLVVREFDPGREPTLVVDASVRALTEVWAGDRTPAQALESREIRVDGAKLEAHDLWRWLGTSAFAATRRAAGRGTGQGW